MKRIIITASAFFISGAIYSQKLFFSIAGGMINYGGDLQAKLFTFNQSNSGFSAGASYKLSNHFYVSASFTRGKLSASDAKSHLEDFKRNLSFYSNLSEGSLTVEADLKDLSVTKFTTYMLGGIALYHFNPYTFDPSGNKVYLQPLGTEGQGLPQYPDKKIYKLTQFAIPFGGGIKYALSDRLIIGAELIFRTLFTDYLDDVSGNYADTAILRNARGPLAAKLSFRGDELHPPIGFSINDRRGNPNRKDAYYTCLIKLSFSFGDLDLSNNSYLRKMRRQAGCPAKIL